MTAINARESHLLGAPGRGVRAPAGAASWQTAYSRWLILADAVAVMLAVGLAHILRFGQLPGTTPVSGRLPYLEVSTVIAASWMAALAINRSRSPRVIGCGTEEYRRVWVATFTVFGAIAITSMLFKLEIARGYLMIALPIGLITLTFFRQFARRYVVRTRLTHGRFITRVLAVGTAAAVRDLALSLEREPEIGFRVVGACIEDGSAGQEIEIPDSGLTIPVFGDETKVVGAATATACHAVAVTATQRLNGQGMRDLSWNLENLTVDLLVAPGVIDVTGPRIEMRPTASLPLIYLEKPQYHGAKRFQKRLFDITFSATALLCGLPLMIAIALAVKLTSRGPVFFRQERIGLDGAPFAMIKFRTMVDGAANMADDLANLGLESSPRDQFKFINDPRVTQVGRILRKYSLDELPQFINVLKREMSIVGPRPQVAGEVESYDDSTRRRLLVRPGITGLWQVSGRSNLSWEDSMRLDLFYVDNWSMVTDFLIAIKTARVVFSHKGAY
jgi:exopolysaccharide biosynthesis polyprenyl glycosylphosphotransferase